MATHPILNEIDAFCEAHGMTESTFGRKAAKDWKLIKELRSGRRLWPETEQKLRDFMVTYRPDAPQEAAA